MSEARLGRHRAARFMTWFALVFSLATAAAYLLLILGQGDTPPERFATVAFVASYLVVLAALLAASLLRRWSAVVRAVVACGRRRRSARARRPGHLFHRTASSRSRGAMATGATVRTIAGPFLDRIVVCPPLRRPRLAVVVLVAGFEVTERLIVCPAHGSSGGGGTGLVTGPYYYDCVNGRLTFHSGSCSSAVDRLERQRDSPRLLRSIVRTQAGLFRPSPAPAHHPPWPGVTRRQVPSIYRNESHAGSAWRAISSPSSSPLCAQRKPSGFSLISLRLQMVGGSRKSGTHTLALLKPHVGGTKCHLYVLQRSSQPCFT